MSKVSVSAIIVAAGEGRRYGEAKQFAQLKGKTVLDWSLECFETHEAVDQIILVLQKNLSREYYLQNFKKISGIADGGAKRQDSVRSGFNILASLCANHDSKIGQSSGIVLIHDAARPLVRKELIDRIIEAVRETGAAVPLIPIEDTVKETTGKLIERTVDRQRLFRAQTPQGFVYSVLDEALRMAEKKHLQETDEASLVEKMNKPVQGIPGERRNIKITNKGDLKIAEVLLED